MLQKSLALFLIVALVGCQSLRPTPLVGVSRDGAVTSVQSVMDRSVHGRVDFTGGRATQATPADVVNAATVSFIDTGSNQTVATSKTDGAGSFSLALGGYPLTSGATYLLEAVKGLNSQAPGSDAARFRTVLQWDGTGWLSCTNGSFPGTIVINALTTALAIETALDATNVPAASTIGKVDVSTNPATLNATPGPYTNHLDSEISQLASDLLSYLGADTDPLASVPAIAPTISSFQPASAGANSLVRIVGAAFSPVPSGNTVTFNGASAQVLLATPTSLVVVVPSGATSGTLRVVTGRGTVNSGSAFTVVASGAVNGLSIASLSRSIARAGETVTLMGQFGTGDGFVTLNSLRCATTSVSPTAITITLPFGATSGPLSYQSGASTATSAQVLTIKQGNLGPFVAQASASELPSTTYFGSTVDYNDSVYLIGGWVYEPGREGPTNRVLRARYTSDGSLGPWEQVGSMLNARQVTCTFVRNNVLYVVGGYTTTYSAEVERATINPDGTLGPFSSAGSLQTARYRMASALVNDRLYVLGGYNTSGALASIEIGTFDGAGNLAFASGGNLPVTCYAQTAAVAGTTILVFGGLRAGAYTASEVSKVIRIPVNGNGSLGAMSYSANLMPEPKTHMFSTVVDDKVYLAGGLHYYTDAGGGHYLTYGTVTVATLDTVTGDVGPFTTYASRLVEPRYGAPVSFNNNRLYVYGGYFQADSGVYQPKTVEVMNLVGGTVETAQTLGTIRARYGHEVVVVGNNAYIVGGYSTVNGASITPVERITLNSDGTTGAPTVISNLATGRHYAAAVAIGNYLYVIGGTNGTYLSSIERAEILPSGALSTPFIPITHTALPMPMGGVIAARIGNWLYLTGGYTQAQVPQPHTYRAPINADNSIGIFQNVPAAVLPEGRSFAASAVVGDYYYIFGGYTTVGTTDVYRSRISADGSLLGFQKSTPLGTPRHYPSVALIGNYLYVISSWTYGANPTLGTIERARVSGNGDLGAWETAPSMTVSRGHPGVAVFGDRIFLIGGYTGVGSGVIDTAVID